MKLPGAPLSSYACHHLWMAACRCAAESQLTTAAVTSSCSSYMRVGFYGELWSASTNFRDCFWQTNEFPGEEELNRANPSIHHWIIECQGNIAGMAPLPTCLSFLPAIISNAQLSRLPCSSSPSSLVDVPFDVLLVGEVLSKWGAVATSHLLCPQQQQQDTLESTESTITILHWNIRNMLLFETQLPVFPKQLGSKYLNLVSRDSRIWKSVLNSTQSAHALDCNDIMRAWKTCGNFNETTHLSSYS